MAISIVIATFNRAALLRITLDHLRCQAYERDDEVIVVDNASTDDTAQVIARAQEDFPVRFLGLLERTSGKTPALITGITAASGDVLALTDDDVVVADDWLTSIRGTFRDAPVDLIGGRVEPVWERPAPRWLHVEDGERYSMLASPLALLHYGPAQPLGQRTAVGANLAIRREVLNALGGFDPHLGRRAGTLLCGEDHDLCLRATSAGYRCEYRPEVRVRHWVPASRMRLAYYLRWFFWSGVTHAMLERGTPAGARTLPPYLLRRVIVALPSAVVQLLARRPARAMVEIMNGVSALGNLTQRIRDRWQRRKTSRSAAGRSGAAPAPHANPAGVEHS